MLEKNLSIGSTVSISKPELDLLLADLRSKGYQTIGPHRQDEVIVYQEIEGLKDLPLGLQSEQRPGSYRLTRTGKDRYFDFIPGGQSWKQFLFPPRHTLFTAKKKRFDEDRPAVWQIDEVADQSPRYALIGVRACELAAIQIQDRIFLRSDFSDPVYRARRQGLFILAVNCLHPGSTCFCASMGTGPQVKPGFDLCLTELDDLFLVKVGSELGLSLLSGRAFELPSAFVENEAALALRDAAESMGRVLDTSDLPELLMDHIDAKHWDQVAERCLSCGNCTQVCPTCFCWDVAETTDILGENTRRERIWDSCFNPTFSYVFGGNTRPNIRSRYRQWLTHKFGAWKEQFGTLGCVGCGRCITWCPVGIDPTEEIIAIRNEVNS